jgi:hypothetical protein
MHLKKFINILILSLLPFTLLSAFVSDHNNVGVNYSDHSILTHNTHSILPDSLRTREHCDSNKVIIKDINLLWNNANLLKLYAQDSLRVIGNPNNILHKGNINIEKINLAHTDMSDDFFKSITFKVLLGSAVLLGGSAAYFKIKGDKKYESYLINKDNSTLNEVNRYDLYSGIAFGLLQINFGYLLYKFIIE